MSSASILTKRHEDDIFNTSPNSPSHQHTSLTERNSLLFLDEEEVRREEQFTEMNLQTPLLASSSSSSEGQALQVTSTAEAAENLSRTQKLDIGELWCKFTSRNRYYILFIVWAVIIPVGLYSFPRFIQSTDSTMHPIPGSYSEQALQIYRESFGPVDGIGLRQDDPMNDDGIIILLKQDTRTDYNSDPDETLIDGSSDTFLAAQSFSLGIQDYLVSNLPISPESRKECYDEELVAIHPSVNVTSYYSLMNDRLSSSAMKLSTIDGHATIIQIGYSIPSCLYSTTATVSKTSGHNVQLNYGQQILESVQTYVDNGVGNIPGVEVGITGMLSFRKDMSSSLSRDLHRMHLIVLPLALVLFSLALGGHILLVMIPITCVLCVVCSWSIVMNALIRNGLQVTQFTPNVMITLTFGLSIDYSLFLLSRALSELKYYHSLVGEELISNEELRHRAIATMIRQIGHIIMTSGITLMSTFLGLLLFPIHSLQSVSIGASICIIMCMVVNLTVVPALLCSDFGAWIMDLSMNIASKSSPSTFLNSGKISVLVQRVKKRAQIISKDLTKKWRRIESSPNLDQGEENQGLHEYTSFRDVLHEPMDDSSLGFQDYSIDQPGSPNSICGPQMGDSWLSEASAQVEIPGQEVPFANEVVQHCYDTIDTSSVWFRLGRFLAKPRKSGFLLLFIVCTLFPVSIKIRDLRTSISIEYMIPTKAPSFSTFLELQNIFGKGALAPYRLILRSVTSNARVDTSDGFETIQNVAKVLEQKMESSSVQANFTGIAWANHAPISHSTFEMARGCASFWECPIESLRELAKLYAMSTTPNGTGTSLSCILSEDPFSDDGVEWLVSTRNKLKALEDSGAIQDFEVVLEGGASIQYDARAAVHEAFPKMLGSIVLAVIILLAVFFRSLSVPLRSVLTIVLTVTSSYGVLSIATKRNWFNMRDNSEISWLTPILSVNMIVGLAIDYDVFLMSSILEARLVGRQNDDSIIIGVCSTGNIITAAGCIMGVSFGGLILSESRLVQEWALVLTSAVLIDTFIMRTCVVPILIAAMGKFAWWPRKMGLNTGPRI